MIGVLVTSKKEWEALLNVYGIDKDLTDSYTYGDYYKTSIYNKDVLLFRSIGRKAMSSAAVQYMIDKFNLKKVVLIGTATLVADYLDYGDIIIPDKVSEYDLSIREIEPLIKDSSVIKLNKVNVSMKYFDGLLGTSDKPLITKKDYLEAKETEMVASDTEAAAVARVCKLNNVDIVVIKGISDRISDEGNYDEQTEVYEENAPVIIDNITRNYLNEVL
jgi:adenosylhomocysteine nucleosidase/adenosylhomocysteine/aminodeoxyfutalosine nucleosidase